MNKISQTFSQRCTPLLVAMVTLGLAGVITGCATGDYAYVTRIATGERLQIPLANGSPVMASKGDFKIANAALVPTPQAGDRKELMYLFAFMDKGTKPLKSVRVEDVTEGQTILMAEDLEPKLTNQRWTMTSKRFTAEDEALSWVAHLDNSMRVFQFTIVEADGTKTVLYQGWMVPGWAKVPMRTALGLK